MKKKLLTQAITIAISGTALYGGALTTASASTTMYNTYITTNQTATDGWVYGFCTTCANNNRAIAYNAANPQAYIVPGDQGKGGFYGTDATNPTAYGATLPFGYGGTSHLNWATHLTSAGDSAEISQADSLARYGYAAEIDTGGGAWRDDGSNSQGVVTGWKHQTDVGLIKSDVTQNITLNLTNLNQAFSAKFGLTVFTGMDTKTAAYVHHGSWNNVNPLPAGPGGTPPAQSVHPYNMNNPFGTVGVTYLAHSDNVDNTAANSFTFTAQAGQIYSIYLGGADFGDWNDNLAAYKLDITTSAVPVPGALWLFGSAMAGLNVLRKRSITSKI